MLYLTGEMISQTPDTSQGLLKPRFLPLYQTVQTLCWVNWGGTGEGMVAGKKQLGGEQGMWTNKCYLKQMPVKPGPGLNQEQVGCRGSVFLGIKFTNSFK